MYYRKIEPKEGELIQYLAIYVLRWPWESGIQPTDAFVEVDDPLIKAAPLLLEALKKLCRREELGNAALPSDYFINAYNEAQAALAAAEPKGAI